MVKHESVEQAVEQARQFRRFAVNVPCFVRPRNAPKHSRPKGVPAQTKDISRGGIAFVGNADWKPGTEFDCTIQLALQPPPHSPVEIKCHGKIVRVARRREGLIEVGASVERFSYPEGANLRQFAD